MTFLVHPLLAQQLHDVGATDTAAPPDGSGWSRLLQGVNQAYRNADADRDLLERSISDGSLEASELNARLAARVAQHEALTRAAVGVATEGDPERIFDLIANEVARLLGVESGRLFRVAPGSAIAEPMGWSDLGRARAKSDRVRLIIGHDTAAGQAYLRGRPVRMVYVPNGGPGARNLLARGLTTGAAAPVMVDGAPWGIVAAASSTPEGLPPGSEEIVAEFAHLASLAVANAEARAKLAEQAATDPLTGLLNHREWHERLDCAIADSRATGHALSVAVLDIDGFKLVNDRFGHLAGDEVLTEIARRARSSIRSEGEVGRTGGEEFAIVLPWCDLAATRLVCERVRRAVGSFPFPEVGRVSISIGAAELQPGESARDLYRSADNALYRAKDEGRDRVCMHGEDLGESQQTIAAQR